MNRNISDQIGDAFIGQIRIGIWNYQKLSNMICTISFNLVDSPTELVRYIHNKSWLLYSKPTLQTNWGPFGIRAGHPWKHGDFNCLSLQISGFDSSLACRGHMTLQLFIGGAKVKSTHKNTAWTCGRTATCIFVNILCKVALINK